VVELAAEIRRNAAARRAARIALGQALAARKRPMASRAVAGLEKARVTASMYGV
jgi:hypothetical protein